MHWDGVWILMGISASIFSYFPFVIALHCMAAFDWSMEDSSR
jgi:hypothetical protein